MRHVDELWPPGFDRIPDQDWVSSPLDDFALAYDALSRHGWYSNLEPTVDEMAGFLDDGSIALDYSGGTGILMRRLFERVGNRRVGVVDVDSSAKFLRVALERSRREKRAGFRLIRYLKDEHRLSWLDEVLGAPLVERRVEAVVSANAIHLYSDLVGALSSWRRVLRGDGRVFIQSGNIAGAGACIIDDTIEAIHRGAVEIVRSDARYRRHRPLLEDPDRMERYDELRRKFFLPARPREIYLEALQLAGFSVIDSHTDHIEVSTGEWMDFLEVYHEGILGWMGGSKRAGDNEPTPDDVEVRKQLMRRSFRESLDGAESFEATWTYLTCEPSG